MNTPSPNSMKRDPGRGSAYLSFLKKRCRDFFFFCLLLGRIRLLCAGFVDLFEFFNGHCLL